MPIAAVLAVTARRRTRTATDAYAELLEAAVRLHTPDLARQLGLDHAGVLTPGLGDTLTDLLRTQLPPPGKGNGLPT